MPTISRRRPTPVLPTPVLPTASRAARLIAGLVLAAGVLASPAAAANESVLNSALNAREGSAQNAGLIGSANAAVSSASVQPASGLPEAEEIFERFIEAIGGREKLEAIENRRITGTYEGDPFEFKANVRIWWESDGRYHQRVAEPAGLKYELFVVDKMTWSVVMDKEPTPIGGVQRQELLDTADFYGEANYKERYKEIKTVREAKAGDTPIYIVRAVTHAGRPHTLFFAKDTGLMIGNRVPVTGPNQSLRDMTVRIEDYKEFGGVLYPTKFVQEFGGGSAPNRFEFTDVEVNVDDGHEYPVPETIRETFEQAREKEENGSADG